MISHLLLLNVNELVSHEVCWFCNFREIPRELLRLAKGGEVNLDMEDHRTEEYVKPKVAVKAFTGEGHKLGRCKEKFYGVYLSHSL